MSAKFRGDRDVAVRVPRHRLASRRAFYGDLPCGDIERLMGGFRLWTINPTSIANSERIV